MIGKGRPSSEHHPQTNVDDVPSVIGVVHETPEYVEKKYNVTEEGKPFVSEEEKKYENRRYDASKESTGTNVWWNLRAERNANSFPTNSSGEVKSRINIHAIYNRDYSFLNRKPYTLSLKKSRCFVGGLNKNKGHTPDHFRGYFSVDTGDYYNVTLDSDQIYTSKDYPSKDVEKTVVSVVPNDVLNNAEVHGYNILPFVLYSSSINKGYQTALTLSHPVQMLGHHDDVYYGDYSKPLQGPFTRTHVGGFLHRRQKLSDGSDTAETRPEMFRVDSSGGIVYVREGRTTGVDERDVDRPFSKYSSEEFVRRAVNIKNVEYHTASDFIGNFDKNYQVVQATNNNLAFIDNNGFNIQEGESTTVSGVLDFDMPRRHLAEHSSSFNKTVIVTRFDAPGSPETHGGFLDVASGQYTVYSALPYRNLTVRQPLVTLLSLPNRFGGLRSGSAAIGRGPEITASFHKINSNPVQELRPLTNTTYLSGSKYDNYFVQYAIPKSDIRYAWITASALIEKSHPLLYGRAQFDGMTTSSDGETPALTVVSESELNADGFSTPFVGMTTIMQLDLSSSNTVQSRSVDILGTLEEYEKLNAYLLTLNGPYQHPMFKQIRGYEHPTTRNLRRTNRYQHIEEFQNKAGLTSGALCDVTHPPVSKKFLPINHTIEVDKENVTIKYTHTNNYDFFGDYYDPSANRMINISRKKNARTSNKDDSVLNNIALSYTGSVKFVTLQHNETIWPRESKAFIKNTREREQFFFPWRTTEGNRLTNITNSFGISPFESDGPLGFSVWPMDATSDGRNGELVQGDNDTFYSQQDITGTFEPTPDSLYISARYGRFYGEELPKNTVHSDANTGPFFDTYKSFSEELRLKGQGYSILPEYNISNVIEAYAKSGSDEFIDDLHQLELTGTLALSSTSSFLETYAHSDYLIGAQDVINTHNAKLAHVEIEIDGLLKLLPYYGFYPQQRTLQLAKQFQNTYSAKSTLAGNDANFRTILTPFYSPGICYNSIKSGLAVDYPILDSTTFADHEALKEISADNPYRKDSQAMPFEAIIDPVKEFFKISSLLEIADTDSEIRVDSTGTFGLDNDSVYTRMADNWYPSVVDTFIEGGKPISFESRPESEWKFESVTGSFGIAKYIGHVKIRKTENMTVHDAANYFGHQSDFTSSNVHHVPPYYGIFGPYDTANGQASNTAYVRILFDPAGVFQQDPDRFIQGKFTLDDIINHSSLLFTNDLMETNNVFNFMPISASVNLFGRSVESDKWNIHTKWESPAINMIDSNPLTTGSEPTMAVKGLWHQYGKVPTNRTEGLFLQTVDNEAGVGPNLIRSTGSLFKAVGITEEDRRIGEVAKTKEIGETVVVIPYYLDDNNEESFLKLDLVEFEEAYLSEGSGSIVSSSLVDMIRRTRQIVLPPKFDFVKRRDESSVQIDNPVEYNPVLSPYAMYLIDFKHNLSQDDLGKWWQGVLPQIGLVSEEQTVKLKHPIKKGEIISPKMLESFGGVLPKNLRFKVFKSKKLAVKKYSKFMNDLVGDSDKTEYKYNYNWPYDFFSLVEMARIKLGLGFKE